MKTVYVLGAGASFDSGYPLCSGLSCSLLEFMCESTNPWILAAGEFFLNEFGQSPNMEDMITAVESRVASLKDSLDSRERAERMRIANHKGWLAAALREFFCRIRGTCSGTYATFAERIVKPSDTIITFNYDDSLEYELRRCGIWNASSGYGFPLGYSEGAPDVVVLKLHGSANWLISLFGGAVSGAFVIDPINSMGEMPVIHRADLSYLGYENFEGRTYESGGAPPCMILPGRSKQFFYDTSLGREFSQFWENLWLQAEAALSGCEKMVICGYSLPEADARARKLLLESMSKTATVEVISGSDSERIAAEFRGAGFVNVATPQGKYFSDWVQSLMDQQMAGESLN